MFVMASRAKGFPILILMSGAFGLSACETLPNSSGYSTGSSPRDGASTAGPPASSMVGLQGMKEDLSRISTLEADNARLKNQLANALRENAKIKKDLANAMDDKTLLKDLAAKKQR
jgi:hypothetical protein